jgi:hypothetical protein
VLARIAANNEIAGVVQLNDLPQGKGIGKISFVCPNM